MDNLTLLPDPLDPRRQAMYWYWQGHSVAGIAQRLGIKSATLHSWKRRDKWDQYGALEKMQLTTAARYCQLVALEAKSGRDFKELDALGRQAERQARIGKYHQSGNEADLNPNRSHLNRGKRPPPVKNGFSDEQISQLESVFQASLFAYQRRWYQAGLDDRFRIRNLLKSRQIGATFYFAREALLDALRTGRNQMFISASKAQAHQFKHYIVDFAATVGVELRGDPISLPNGAELHFLGTNTNTAQGRSGNLYVDEYFWIPGFQKLRRAASGMASQKQYRQTYFSTPSSVNHEAYPFWRGTLFHHGRAKQQRLEVDVSYPHLAAGVLCADGQYKQIVTLEDALAGGCDRFDITQLRRENSEDDFANLYRCQFIDDAQSVFPMKEMQRCMVDSGEQWPDVKLLATRPYGYQSVWIGYDPASTGDASGCAVIAPPTVAGGKFRVLERFQWHGMDFAQQARQIQTLTERYQVSYIGIDDTGLGRSVTQLVRQFFPAVQAIHYTVEMKTDLIYKAKDVITSGRLEFDASQIDIAKAFMSIRKTLTPRSQRATYVTHRAEGTSHGDVAWAIMHALFNEPLAGITANNRSFMEIF